MTFTFKQALQEQEKKYAYYLGTRAFYYYIVSKQLAPKYLRSPFEKGTKEDLDWHDGYMDAFFLHNCYD